MASKLITLPFRPTINLRGGVEAGAKLFVYSTGTTTPVSVYSDSALATPLTNPVVADAFGVFPDVYYNDAQVVRVVMQQANGTVLSDTDPYISDTASAEASADAAATSAAAAEAIARPIYANNAAGLAATAEGDFFFVDQGDGTADLYRHDAGPTATAMGRTTIIDPQGSGAAGLIGYTQGGAGASARTVQTKLREFVSVKDFGAVGDGTTDDTSAIQSALNSGATRIYAPRGTYKLSSRVTIDTRGLLFLGDGIEQTVFDYTGSTDVFYVTAGQMRFADFTIDGNGTTGAGFQTSETASAETCGVFDFFNVQVTDAGHGIIFGEAGTDFSQADSRMCRCLFYRMSVGGVKVVHDQGLNYLFEQNTFADIMGSAIHFVKGGKACGYQNAIRNIGTFLEVNGAGESSDYFSFDGISVDGNIASSYPQWHKLVDAQRGNIIIANYSSGNAGATPTDPLITLNGYGEVILERSRIVPSYTWDGATGVPIADLTGTSSVLVSSLILRDVDYGSDAVSAKDFTTICKRNNTSTYFSWDNVTSVGRRYSQAPNAIVAGQVTVSGSATNVPFFGSLTYVPLTGNVRPVLLAVRVSSGSISGAQQVQVTLQRRRGGVLGNLGSFTMDSTHGTPEMLIGEGSQVNPTWDYKDGDELRVSVNDLGTGATPTLWITVGFAPS